MNNITAKQEHEKTWEAALEWSEYEDTAYIREGRNEPPPAKAAYLSRFDEGQGEEKRSAFDYFLDAKQPAPSKAEQEGEGESPFTFTEMGKYARYLIQRGQAYKSTITTLRSQLAQCGQKIEELNDKLEVSDYMKQDAWEQIKTLRSQLAEAEGKIKRLTRDRETLMDLCRFNEDQLADLQSQLEQKK